MNLATNSMEKLTKMLINTDSKLKDMGKTPYGQRKATAKEERERFDNLTFEGLMSLIEQYGVDEVNTWLGKFTKEDNYGR